MAERDNNKSKEATSNTDKFFARHQTICMDSKGNFKAKFYFIVNKY